MFIDHCNVCCCYCFRA